METILLVINIILAIILVLLVLMQKSEGGALGIGVVKKEISFPAKISIQEQVVDIQSEFTINRRLWGINYNGKANNLIKDDVLIKLNVQYK